MEMICNLCVLAVAALLLVTMFTGEVAFAQKQGGVLKIGQFDSPASMSIHEESSNTAEGPMMGVFNNLVVYDQHVPQNSIESIRPDLATDWSWDEDRTRLTFHLRHSVKWHDGQPFTAHDVKCTWGLLTGKASETLRLNPRKAWYRNLEEVTTNGDYEVTFTLRRPQPALLALLASGWAPVYPCHVSPRDMRSHPIGTGPFKFVEFKPNEVIRVARNPDYWKPGRPYLDGIVYPIIKNVSTASSNRSTTRCGLPRSCDTITWSHRVRRSKASTTPIRRSTRLTPAVPKTTPTDIAIPRSTGGPTSNRPNSTSKS